LTEIVKKKICNAHLSIEDGIINEDEDMDANVEFLEVKVYVDSELICTTLQS
jgi:hypothetical protein